jgi:hypothetical protein
VQGRLQNLTLQPPASQEINFRRRYNPFLPLGSIDMDFSSKRIKSKTQQRLEDPRPSQFQAKIEEEDCSRKRLNGRKDHCWPIRSLEMYVPSNFTLLTIGLG